MFVLSSSFDVPPYSLPDLGSNNSFGDYVENAERVILKKLFGKTFYDEFVVALNALPSEYVSTVPTVVGDEYVYGNSIWEALTVQTGTAPSEGSNWTIVEENNKWLKLKNGFDYELNEKTYEWIGMVEMLKPFIYYSWTKDTFDTQTGNGIVIPDAENGSVINPGSRLSYAFNNFSKIVGYGYSEIDSLYGYMKANKVDFPDVYQDFKTVGRINILDL
jgi:hypothetical protein